MAGPKRPNMEPKWSLRLPKPPRGAPWGPMGSPRLDLGRFGMPFGIPFGTLFELFGEKNSAKCRSEFCVRKSCILMEPQGSKQAFRPRGASISEKSPEPRKLSYWGQTGLQNGALRRSGAHFSRRCFFADLFYGFGGPHGLRQYTSEVVKCCILAVKH